MKPTNYIGVPLILLTLLLGCSRTASAGSCNIKGLDCWGSGSKCNIQFKNNTGESSGSGGSLYNQKSFAVTIKVHGILNGSKTGNKLEILAGDAKHKNLDNLVKKEGFDSIEIEQTSASSLLDYQRNKVKRKCVDIKKTLNGNGTCKVLSEKFEGSSYGIAVTCNQKTVWRP